MKKILFSLMSLFAGLAVAGSASALTVSDYTAGVAAGGIGGTRHNLGSFGPVIHTGEQASPFLAGMGTTEICVFCHTPHHTNTALGPTPLWNRVNATTTFTTYGPTIGGSNVTAVGSVSLACLSCHDGVTTFDNLVNAPGKGGVNSAGKDQGWWFLMPGGVGSFTNPLDHFDPSAGGACASCHVSLPGGMGTIARLTIGTDLSNDHPVSVTYTTGRAGLRQTNTVISAINLTAGLNASAPTLFGGNLAQNRWAVKGFISDTATIADLLRDNKVECSSCHDPHFKNSSWDEVESVAYENWCGTSELCTDGQFLRRVGGNTGSGVCRTCHDK
ncbi:MAG: hypothetical protein HY891_03190 [Deltaproteobacteria bacterium]|nr:hypothetical protein [Deltaproteobacteria bacterium]